MAGVRSDVGLSLYGDDLGTLKTEGDKIVRSLSRVPGAADVQAFLGENSLDVKR